MRKLFVKFLDLLTGFYETNIREFYTGVFFIKILLIILTAVHENFYGPSPSWLLTYTDDSLSIWVAVLAIILILADLLRQSAKPTPTHSQIVAVLVGNRLVSHVLTARSGQIRKAQSSPNESEMMEHLDEIMQVVQGEWKYVPIFKVIRLFMKSWMIVALYAILSVNLTICFGDIFGGLSRSSAWLAYVYNTIAGMFLIGYGFRPEQYIAQAVATRK